MTVEQAKAKLCAWAQAQVGYREGENNWNKYANMAAVQRLYGGSIQNAPWCDLFTDAGFTSVFGLEIGAAMTYQTVGNGSALCRTSAAYFREHGAFVKRPEPGDVIFFFVGGEINHQGIVVRVDGGSVFTVEGNSSDMVAERCYSVSDGRIAGYGRPRWELAAIEEYGKPDSTAGAPAEEPKPEDSSFTLAPPVLRCGMGGPWAAAMQGALVFHGLHLGHWGVDGEFGSATETALRNFQTRRGLPADGVCGPLTWAALLGGKED